MLICVPQKLTFFAVPKTGSTSYQAALLSSADGIVSSDPDDKHMTLRRYRKTLEPEIVANNGTRFETMAVLRDPVQRLGSWYKYRRRLPASNVRSTQRYSFEDFIAQTLLDTPPAFAAIGDQRRFTTDPDGVVRVDHLFAIETPEALQDFLAQRFGALPEIPRMNVSDPADTSLSSGLEETLRAARSEEIALHASIVSAGGYLKVGERPKSAEDRT